MQLGSLWRQSVAWSKVRRVVDQLERLTAEAGLWANVGGYPGDLSDAYEWMAQSKARRSMVSTAKNQATDPRMTDQVAVVADAVVAWMLAPFFRCCEEMDKIHEISIGTVFSNAVVQFMLQIFIVFTNTTARVRARALAAP